jgi:SWI/SNF-related matrix-associated actin-dependent regulator 1 of chromatin subfamily A
MKRKPFFAQSTNSQKQQKKPKENSFRNFACKEGAKRLSNDDELLSSQPTAKRLKQAKVKQPKQQTHNEDLHLQFEFRDGEIIAFNETHTMPLGKETHFDFDDYHRATQTRVFPPKYQTLVQNALIDNQRAHCIEQVESVLLLRFPADLVGIISDYAQILGYCKRDVDAILKRELALQLMPHQKIALDFVLSRESGLLALDMGVGKTAVSIAVLLARTTTTSASLDSVVKSNNLVICPSTLKHNWLSEFKKFINDKSKVHIIEITSAKLAAEILSSNYQKCANFVVSYELLHKVADTLLKYKWDTVVFDEAHAIKHHKSSRSQAALAIRKKCKHVLLLTGTPTPVHQHFWNLLRFLDMHIFADFFHYKPPTMRIQPSSETFFFAERYTFPQVVYDPRAQPRWTHTNSARMEELHALTRQYVIRQKKEDVLDLPPLIREYIVIGRASQSQIRKHEHTIIKAAKVAEEKGAIYAKAILNEEVRETALHKLPFVLKYLSTFIEADENHEKIIVWAHSKEVIEGIHLYLDKIKSKHIVVNGDTPSKKRPGLFKQFETDPNTRIAVFSLTACGTGLNFAFCHLAIYAELTFFYIEHMQSEARVYRVGSTGSKVVLVYLVFEGLTDEGLWNAMFRKTNTESLVLDNKKSDFLYETLLNIQHPEQPCYQECLAELKQDAEEIVEVTNRLQDEGRDVIVIADDDDDDEVPEANFENFEHKIKFDFQKSFFQY